jgi:hypothetical protein
MRYLCLIFLLPCFGYALTPVDYQKWQVDDTTFVKTVGGAVRNYPHDGVWDSIANHFEVDGDSAYAHKAVLKATVNQYGVSTVRLNWQGVEYTVTQKLLGIGWIKISTRQSQWIDSAMDWSGFSVDSNIAMWRSVSPGVDYHVLKDNGRVAHGIFFKPAFLDSAVTLYNQREDSLDIALANVMVYTLSANIDDADSAIGDVAKRRLKDLGYYSFNIRDQWLRFPGCDTLPLIPIRQYWERRGSKIVCIEYVMMRWVKQVHEVYPGAVIWHNDSKVIEGTTNVEDTYFYIGSPDNNYGAATSFGANYNQTYGLIRAKNIDTELGAGATITACICSSYCSLNSGTKDISACRIYKPWNEGTENGANCTDPGCSYNDWACDDYEWTTAGGQCAGDDGSDNSADDGTCGSATRDRRATAEDTESVGASDAWFAWNISTALAQDWYDGDANEEGIMLMCDASGYSYFRTTEYTSNQPFWTFVYTTGGGPEIPNRRRRIIQNMGGNK